MSYDQLTDSLIAKSQEGKIIWEQSGDVFSATVDTYTVSYQSAQNEVTLAAGAESVTFTPCSSKAGDLIAAVNMFEASKDALIRQALTAVEAL